MNVDTMRKIDRNVGIPLTFLFTIPVLILDALLMRKNSRPDVQRTLFIELSEMGSAVLVDPAMRKIRDAGKAELYFAIFEENSRSLDILGTVPGDHIFRMRADGMLHLTLDVFRFISWCRKNRITCVIDLELFSRFTALLSALSGARHRAGFVTFHDEGMYRGRISNIPVRYNPHVHIAVNFINLVNSAMGMHDTPYATTPVSNQEIQLSSAPREENKISVVLQKIKSIYPGYRNERIILLNVNASDMLPQRRWPPENFTAVGRHLLDSFNDVILVATGSPKEKDYVQEVVDAIGSERCVNAAGLFEFLELIPLYHVSTLMLTNDSGPAHFASVTELKIFTIFGPETPALYGPLGNAENFYLGLPCSPCVSAANHRKTTCLTRPCITGLLPAVVSSRLVEFLNA